MPLQKQQMNMPFAQGLDTKTDPLQIPPGKFLALSNTVFNKGGLLQKRNGFGDVTTLNADHLNTISTYNGNLTAIGDSLFSYSQDSMQWLNKGPITSVSLSTLPLVRTSTQQKTIDIAISPLGLVCTTWMDSAGTSNYQIVDSVTGQVFIANASLRTGASIPRVFSIGQYFVITYLVDITGTTHLQYISVSINNVNTVSSPVDISTQVNTISAAYDGQVIGGNLYLAWDASDGGGAVRMVYIDPTLNQHSASPIVGKNAVVISVCGDTTSTPIIWVSFKDASNNGWTASFTSQLISVLAPTAIWSGINVINLTSFAKNGINTVFYQTSHTYSFSSVRSDFISKKTITSSGTVSSATVIERGVSLTSKAFQINTTVYMLVSYGGVFQPTYFLIDSTGNVVAKLAYSNGGGYPFNQILCNSIVTGNTVHIGYLFKDQLTSVNKEQTGSTGGIYSQTGLNLVTMTLANQVMGSVEIGGAVHYASGFLWMYDGVKPVEHGFHLWPEDVGATTSSIGGFLAAQQYFYQVTYEWTDGQGNIHRSAPSVPLNVDLSSSMTATNSVVLNIPTLRLTYKTAPNSVRILVYRWSTTNQQYYQVTSIASPVINDPSVDSIAYTDILADSSIIGNALIYTTGGVIENIGAPACNAVALFKSRLMLIDAENPSLIWFSKVVIQGVPVEMSDLLTIFAAPTTGAQGSTGPCTVITALDDKFIIFKKDAGYYLTGSGPDNTGANNDFSDPIFITSTVGCTNPQSLAFMPNGIMFQSDKGIWLLGRDLSTSYIGADVEAYNSSTILSALTIPGTNQVRFTLDSETTLMYDYYYGQWGTFNDIPALSSTLYQGLHTLINSFGNIRQETPGVYLDGAKPVLMSFTTGWLNLSGLQGFQRAYFFYLLGQFISPHKLQILIAYDYNAYPTQSTIIYPDNYNKPYGGDTVVGGSTQLGGNSVIEQDRIFFDQQKCQAFQITINEIFDSTFGVPAGAGLTLSGLNMVVGLKGRYPKLAPKYSVG